MSVVQSILQKLGLTSAGAVTQDLAGRVTAGNTVTQVSAAGAPVDGIFRDTLTSAGEAASLAIDGIILGIVGGTVTDLDEVMVDATGKFVKAEAGSHRVGQALESGTVGQIIRIRFYKRGQQRPKLRGANVASAATIAVPQGADYFHVTGVAAIGTITLPTGFQDGEAITIVPDGIFTWTAAGNIAVAGTAVVSRHITMTWDSTLAKWFPSYV